MSTQLLYTRTTCAVADYTRWRVLRLLGAVLRLLRSGGATVVTNAPGGAIEGRPVVLGGALVADVAPAAVAVLGAVLLPAAVVRLVRQVALTHQRLQLTQVAPARVVL